MPAKRDVKTKGFGLTPEDMATVDRALRDYREEHDGASDPEALMAFIAAWGQERKTALVPGSSDALKSFDRHMEAARNEIVSLSQEIADARDGARLEVQGELDRLKSRQDGLADALREERAKVAELEAALADERDANAQLKDMLEAKDEAIYELTERAERAEAASKLVELVEAMTASQSPSEPA